MSAVARRALLAEILACYRQLQALPSAERPTTNDGTRRPAYLAIEAEIRTLADRYRQFEDWTIIGAPLVQDHRSRRAA
jgi:hypothetical protein